MFLALLDSDFLFVGSRFIVRETHREGDGKKVVSFHEQQLRMCRTLIVCVILLGKTNILFMKCQCIAISIIHRNEKTVCNIAIARQWQRWKSLLDIYFSQTIFHSSPNVTKSRFLIRARGRERERQQSLIMYEGSCIHMQLSHLISFKTWINLTFLVSHFKSHMVYHMLWRISSI